MTGEGDPPANAGDHHQTLPAADEARASAPERRIGPYRILHELGQGGMGTVYLAVRADEQFEKRVALKIIRSGADSSEVVRHFKRERQILAGLDHPNIARLLDGGATDGGLPYLVMEYIEGEQILHYCDSRSLPVGERLKLFQSVCSAVQYAHRSLVVHRDIKPGNILVAADGSPRLLDFGIAKLLSPDLSGEAPTATSVAMTPAYASPEQARGERVTTASDVYSLGVVLYELLSGRLPYRLASHQALDVLVAVSEQEPEKPSAAVGRVSAPATLMQRTERETSAATSPTEGMAAFPEDRPAEPPAESIARAREGTPEKLKRRLQGDLDNILMTALRKEPQRRYASVEALSDDIRRHLEGLPVLARKPTLGYRAGKFVRRHTVAVAAAVALAALLVAFVVAMAVQSARVARERDLAQRERAAAQRERATAEQVSAFLVDLFKVSDPSEARGNTITAREVLDKGAARIATELEDQPEVRATLMETMGTVYRDLGLFDKATPLLREALATRRTVLGNEHLEVARSLHDLATVLRAKGDYAGAEALLGEALAIQRRGLGNEHVDVAKSLNSLGAVLLVKGDFTGAEALFREALALRRKLLGSEHPEVASIMTNVAGALMGRGDLAGAEALQREAVLTLRRALGNEHPSVAINISNLATLLVERDNLAEAEALFREAVALQRKLLGDEHPHLAIDLCSLADALCRAQKPAEAEPLARESLAILQKAHPGGHWNIAMAEGVLGRSLALSRRYADAEALLLGSHPVLEAKLGRENPEARKVGGWIVELYEAWGKPEKAARYRARLAASGAGGVR
jgi:serine/threonine-protein kinase